MARRAPPPGRLPRTGTSSRSTYTSCPTRPRAGRSRPRLHRSMARAQRAAPWRRAGSRPARERGGGPAAAGRAHPVQIGTYPGPPGWGRDGAHGPVSGGLWREEGLRGRELGDDAAAEQAAVRVVQGARLPWRDGPHRLGEVEGDRPAHLLPHPAGNGRGAVAALYQNRIPRRQRVGEPVELRERHAVAEQLVPRADHDFARLAADRDHVHRLAEPAGEAATLPDPISRETRRLPPPPAPRPPPP